MANEVEKFDPSQLMEGVKTRIRATFVSLIPDDAWENMVKTEIDSWFKRTDGYNSYHTQDLKPSHFTRVVYDVLTKEATEKIKEILNSPDFYINNTGLGRATVSEQLQQRIIEKAPDIFMALIQSSIAAAIETMRQKNY